MLFIYLKVTSKKSGPDYPIILLISSSQSWFKPGDSYVNQLLFIAHKMYHVLLMLLRWEAFSLKVWHGAFIFKHRENGVIGKFLNILKDFMKIRKWSLVWNGQYLQWINVNDGTPQSSILGLQMFLICINDVSENEASHPKLFVDNTSLFSVVKDCSLSVIRLDNIQDKLSNWACQWKMSLPRNVFFLQVSTFLSTLIKCWPFSVLLMGLVQTF